MKVLQFLVTVQVDQFVLVFDVKSEDNELTYLPFHGWYEMPDHRKSIMSNHEVHEVYNRCQVEFEQTIWQEMRGKNEK